VNGYVGMALIALVFLVLGLIEHRGIILEVLGALFGKDWSNFG
jgi:hypothetical protein